MSYDIFLRSSPCEHCGRPGEEPGLPDPTYNLTPIFDLALTGESLPNPEVTEASVVLFGKPTDRPRGLRLLSEKRARDTLRTLEEAVDRLKDPGRRAELTALEPPNGWGTLGDAVKVMGKLLEAAKTYPDNVWEVR